MIDPIHRFVLVKEHISIKPSLHDINITSIHKFYYDQNNAPYQNSMDIHVAESKFREGGV